MTLTHAGIGTLHEVEAFLLELADWAMSTVRGTTVTEVSTKRGPADPVSALDRAIEDHVRARTLHAYPTIRFVGEERGASGEQAPGALTWHLDPVDGTTNLVHGIGWNAFSMSLGQVAGDGTTRPLAGVVAHPWLRQIASATDGGGVRITGGPATVRPGAPEPLAGAVVLTELDDARHWRGFAAATAALADADATVRILGSGALSLASLATATHTAVYLPMLNPIDHGAGLLIAAESGATLLRPDGRTAPVVTDGPLVAATSPALAAALAQVIAASTASPGMR